MAMTKLCHRTIGDLDEGAAGLIIDKAINEVLRDLDDRGNDDKLPRKVAIEIEAEIKEDRLVFRVHANAKLPPRKTRATIAVMQEAAGESRALFQTDNGANPEQNTLEFDAPPGDVEPGAEPPQQ